MYLGVTTIVVGEAVLFGSLALLAYAASVLVVSWLEIAPRGVNARWQCYQRHRAVLLTIPPISPQSLA